MTSLLPALAQAAAGQSLPPMATTADAFFAYGAVALIVALIWWHGRNIPGPPGE